MKVAVILDSFPKVSESFILNQIVSLVEKKIEVRIFAARGPDRGEPVNELYTKYKLDELTEYEPKQATRPLLRKAGHALQFARLLFRAPRLFFRLVSFQKILFNRPYLYAAWPFLQHTMRFDVVHAHFGPIGVKVCNLQDLGFLQAPLVCSFHGFDVDRNDFRSRPKYYNSLFARARFITGNSKFTSRNIHALGCPQEKLAVIPESLFTAYFKPDRKALAEDIVRVLTVARLVEFKGVDYALKTVASLVKRGRTQIRYVVVGDGPMKQSLIDLAVNLGIESYVEFAGAKSQDFIIDEMKMSDIFLLTGITATDGRQENQGLVLQEAQAMKLPVVASLTGGIPEGMIDNVTGYLVPEKDVEAFVEKLDKLIKDPALRRDMGEQGRKLVMAKFDSNVLAADLIRLYEQAIAG